MRPIEQVEPSSYIGLALKGLKGGRKPTEEKSNSSSESDKPSECSDPGGYESSDETESSDESSISESLTSSSSESSDESLISTLSTISSSCKRKGRKRSNKGERSSGKKRQAKQKSSKRKKHQKMKLKPIPPNEYDGAVDPQMFHRFITEGTAYVRDGQVPVKKRVFFLSHYLTGRAHEFYMHEVSGDPYRWHLPKFFKELFNYCFPIDFRMKQ